MPTFSTPRPISASIDVVMGDVRVSAGDRDETTVEVAPSNASVEADVRDAEQTRVEFADGRLRVVGPKRRTVVPSRKNGSVDVSVVLPAGSHLDASMSLGAVHGDGRLGDCTVKTSAGDIVLQDAASADLSTSVGVIDVHDVAGAADCSTGSGSVRIARIGGAGSVKNSNGDTWVGEVDGDLRVKAANGDIAVDHAAAGVAASTANGTIAIGRLDSGRVELKTALGRIDVGILEGTAARLDLHTSFGVVRNDLDSTAPPAPTETTVDVHARTSYGDIVVRRSGLVP